MLLPNEVNRVGCMTSVKMFFFISIKFYILLFIFTFFCCIFAHESFGLWAGGKMFCETVAKIRRI